MRGLFAATAVIALVCGAAAAENVPLPRPRPAQPVWVEPKSFAEAVAGLDFDAAAVTAEPTDCGKRLAPIAAIEAMPRLIGPGACGGGDMVRLSAIVLADNTRIDIKPAPLLRCPMAEQIVAWVREDAGPRVAALGSNLRQIDTFDDYECRGRNRVFGARMSEHGKGNALDVRGFMLADGRAIGLTDVTAAKDLRQDLHDSACRRFTTVLGPGADGHHEQHIHLDLADRNHGYRICEWDVREPLTEIAGGVPLPRPRPAELAALDEHKL